MPDKFKLTLLAKEDIREIWNYSIEVWNEEQADKYIFELYNRFEWLSENSNIGIERDEIGKEYLSYFHESHTIFYRKINENIEIIGIPHQSEDVIKHLDN